MKVYNKKHSNLTLNILSTLESIRLMRGFDSSLYIQAKIKFLNEYMQTSGLSACVVAVSGGIDSAIVLGLVVKASQEKNSPIKRIVPISLPALSTQGATNQTSTVNKAKELCEQLGVEQHIFQIDPSFEQIFPQIEKSLNQKEPDNWARGQLVAYSRTPFLYYATSVLSSQGFPSIIVGTTNRDEGAYLGYVGKASDGMVDIQLISDLHKSEAYKIAHELDIVESIISAVPAGDMYDGRIDEEVFGAPYDFVELYLNYKNISQDTWNYLTKSWSEEDNSLFLTYSNALEKLHKYNQHKYWSGSQAIHLDVLDSAVKDGWIEGIHTTIYKAKESQIIPTHRFVGFVDTPPTILMDSKPSITAISESIAVIDSILGEKEIKSILEWKDNYKSNIVRTNQYGKTDSSDVGSNRLSFYCSTFAKQISERLRIAGGITDLSTFYKQNTNWKPYPNWRFIGVNPMFRLIEYKEGDYLVPHYDDSFYQSSSRRSLLTLVIFLANDCVGGATRFIFDKQDNISLEQKNFSDWDREPETFEIQHYLKPTPGGALIFPHRLLHDGERIHKGNKIILRSELMFESCTSSFLKK